MSAAAVAAAVGVAREHGLRVDEPVVLHDLFSLRVLLRPAPVVARVPTWVARLLPDRAANIGRELAVVEHLQAQGVPVVPPSAELPPGPHAVDEFTISFWTYAPPDADRPATAADCAAMLPGLHAGLATFPGAVPDLVDVVALPHLVAALDRAPHRLDAADVELLRRRAAEFVMPAGGTTVLHGDVHMGNVLWSGGELRWIDFEEVARGPVEWDVATIGDDAVLTGLDPTRLAACRRLRDLQLALCLAGLDDVFGDLDGWMDTQQYCLGSLRTQ